MPALSMPNSPAQPNFWIGRLIGDRDRYRLEHPLSQGGMGDVFVAMDTRLGKLVALKVLKESLITAAEVDFRERFERECAICAALKSEHIVQVSDYGVTPEGNPFYVMEYLEGQTLNQLLDQQPRLSVSRTCQIMMQVCAGLQLAHQGVFLRNPHTGGSEHIRVVHRDLKPANIFLVPTALGELVKIIDFGVAKIRSLQAENTSATSVFLGTCHYAAPEQFDIGDVDERTDIYSLGMILYEMLTGTDPFGFDFRNNPVGSGAWLAAHASKPPVPLRLQPGCDHLSPQLEAVVMRCLEKTPDTRFSSVTELSQALQHAAVDDISPSERMRVQAIASDIAFQAAQGSRFHNGELEAAEQPNRGWLKWSLIGLLIGGGLLATELFFGPQFRSSNSPDSAPVTFSNGISDFSLVRTLADHAGSVWSVAVSFDGRSLVSGGEDNTIKVWDIDSGTTRRTLAGHQASVRSLDLSADGQTLASGSGDQTIKIWDLQTGAVRRTLEGHTNAIWSVALSSDGQTLASGSEDKTIQTWDLQTGTLRRTLAGHTGPVYTVALSRDGQTLASGSADKTIKVWNWQTGALSRTLTGHRDAVRSIAFSPDGQQLASASWDKTVKLWNPQTGELLHTLEGHGDRVVSVAFSFNGKQLASASIDNTIKIWDTQTGKLLQTLTGHRDWVLSVATSPSDHTLVSSSKDGTIKIWR